MKEAYIYEKLVEGQVRCGTCPHRCLIMPGMRGICGVRKNIEGKLFSLVYGQAAAVHIDPIEKKPFYHFLPGTYSLSFSTVGCNFQCPYCQNWQISQSPKPNKPIIGDDWPPEKLVEEAIKNACPSISYTYTEPTVFMEYALDTMKLAKKKGLKNTWVTNGFMTKETLAMIVPYLDAANVDLKSFDDEFYQKYCGGRVKPVLETIKRMHQKKIHIEITTLVVPGLNDKEDNFKKIAQFIKKLSSKIPWHISRFFPAWKMQDLSPTPISVLEKAQKIGLKIGLKNVYIGNV